jgi:hypothetical protein
MPLMVVNAPARGLEQRRDVTIDMAPPGESLPRGRDRVEHCVSCIVSRASMFKLQEPAAGPQHASDLVEGGPRVGYRTKDECRDDCVE